MKRFAQIFLIVALLYVGVAGFFFPMQGDDFIFAVAVRDNGVLPTIAKWYCFWTLRSGEVAGFFLYRCGKTLFDALHIFLQFFLAWSLFLFAFRHFPKWRDKRDVFALALLMAASIVWVGRPRDTVFWMSGCLTYTLGLGFWFCFWGLLRREVAPRPDRLWRAAGLFLFAIFAATAVESATVAGFFLIGQRLWQRFREKRRLSFDEIAAFSGYGVGCLLFATAPGRWLRFCKVTADTVPAGILARLFEIGAFWVVSAWSAILLFAVCALWLYFADKKRLQKEFVPCFGWIALSGVAAGSFFLAGVAPAMRAYLFSALLWSAAAIKMLLALIEVRKSAAWVGGAILLLTLAVMATAIPDLRQIHREECAREKQLFAASPDDTVVVAHHTVVRRNFLQYVWIEDLFFDPAKKSNRAAAKWYGIAEIRVDRDEKIPLYWKRAR